MKPWTILEGSATATRESLRSPHPGARAFACHRAVAVGLGADELLSVLGDSNWIVRAAAARAVGKLSGASPAVARAVGLLLGDPEPTVRRLAVQALGLVGDAAVVPALVDMLESGASDDLRAAVVVALGTIGDGAAVAPLLGAVGDDALRSHAIEALGAIGDERAFDPLVRLFTDGVNGFEEWYIVAALGEIGDRRAVLDGMSSHPDPETRRMLGRVADTWWPDEEAVHAIIAQMDDSAATVRSGAAYRLRNWKLPPNLVDPVKAALRKGIADPDEDVRHWCAETLDCWDED